MCYSCLQYQRRGRKFSISGHISQNSRSSLNSCPIRLTIGALESRLNSEGDANLERNKIPIFTLCRIGLSCFGMHVARNCRACIIGLLGVMSVLHIMYLLSVKATEIILSTKVCTTNAERGGQNMFYIDITISPPNIDGVCFCAQN